MLSMIKRTSFLLAAVVGMAGMMWPEAQASDDVEVTVGGAYLGAAVYLDQDNRPDSAAQRRQFDLAANIDVAILHGDQIEGALQLQTGSGGSAIGFVGSEDPATLVVLTDANLTYRFLEPNISLTAGSYDTPFGEETAALTNNGDASANSFFLNSLFYGALAGTQVGTLNTIGIMANWRFESADATLSVSNGTDEAADNPDGNFEIAARLGLSLSEDAHVAGSYLYSDDNSVSGSNGTGALFSGWLAEGKYNASENGYLKGYFGRISYDDGGRFTDDDVTIWMAEGAWKVSEVRLAARVSGWTPGDDDGDGQGVSARMVSPGLAVGFDPDVVLLDQKAVRYQVAATKKIHEQAELKLEFVFDDLDYGLTRDIGANVTGLIFGINTTF